LLFAVGSALGQMCVYPLLGSMLLRKPTELVKEGFRLAGRTSSKRQASFASAEGVGLAYNGSQAAWWRVLGDLLGVLTAAKWSCTIACFIGGD